MLIKLLQNLKIIFIIFATLLISACSEKRIVSVPTESEAIEIVVVLQGNGIQNVDKRPAGTEQKKEFEIFVYEGIFGDGSYGEALRILNDYCLPYEKPEEIQTKGMVDANETLKNKTHRLLKIEVTQQLRKTIPGITCIDLVFTPQQNILDRLNPSPSSASISLKYKDSPPRFTNEEIRDLVSKALPDMKPENVKVVSTYIPIDKANLTTQNAQIKTFILIGSAAVLIFLLMLLILLLRRRKPAEDDDENDVDESGVPLLEAADDIDDE
jgi:type III secretion protein J